MAFLNVLGLNGLIAESIILFNINTSSKGSNHGYGIKIIKDIVKKYSGDREINIKDKEFEIVIIFKR